MQIRPIEAALGAAKAHVTFLRAAYFMENLLANLHPMKEQGVLTALFSGDRQVEMVATADIGATAAELLRAGTSAPKVVELAGPATTTLAEAARAFSGALKKAVKLAPVPPAAQVEVLKGVGLSQTWAQGYADMSAAMESKKLAFEPPPSRGVAVRDPEPDTGLRVDARAQVFLDLRNHVGLAVHLRDRGDSPIDDADRWCLAPAGA